VGAVEACLRTLHPTPCALHPAPYTLHPTLYTLRPTPYTLHPAPYTRLPTPYTLHLNSSSLNRKSNQVGFGDASRRIVRPAELALDPDTGRMLSKTLVEKDDAGGFSWLNPAGLLASSGTGLLAIAGGGALRNEPLQPPPFRPAIEMGPGGGSSRGHTIAQGGDSSSSQASAPAGAVGQAGPAGGARRVSATEWIF
jgi:hypothetical protein